MDKGKMDICCNYGFSVNLLIDNIECLLEDIEAGEEITEKNIGYTRKRIEVLREKEIEFKRILGVD